jgi:hypothetical protein
MEFRVGAAVACIGLAAALGQWLIPPDKLAYEIRFVLIIVAIVLLIVSLYLLIHASYRYFMRKNEAVNHDDLNSTNILVRVSDTPKTCSRFLVFREVHITNCHHSLKASLHILLAASHAPERIEFYRIVSLTDRERSECELSQQVLASVIDIEPRKTVTGALVFDMTNPVDSVKLVRPRDMKIDTVQLRLKDMISCVVWTHPERFPIAGGLEELIVQASFVKGFEENTPR